MKADAPSATAYLIATSTLFVAADPFAGRLIPARAAELSAHFVEARTRVARWAHDTLLRRKAARPFVAALERLTLPGIQLHYALRKLYLEETTRAAIADGIRQVVIFGAGYDTLALRLHEAFPGVQFIETDHPATQRRKIDALAAATARRDARSPAATNLRFLPLDLTRRNLADALLNFDGYRADAPTLFIAEGLLMYLAPAEVDALFRAIRDCSDGAPIRFAFTFMERQADGRINFLTRSRAVEAWLSWRREVFKWGIGRGELPAYLAARGFALREIGTDETFRRRYLEPEALAHLPLAAGEYVCVAGDLDARSER
ncbi:MAG TPA: class I SAM-dependent methyltransferase [Pyrinomonadaceae bacterium]|jgi:methyltransferase (TIGR00027 family)|nr:class I SAM-dependent methyltransferase [Pyrinomonadaceae bacterium]